MIGRLIIFIFVFLIGFTPFSVADFYVIPITKKSNTIHVKTSGGNFNNPIAALESIKDSSVTNPYIIILGPGEFNIGSKQLVMKPYVQIVGSGIDISLIVGSYGHNESEKEGALVIAQEGNSISNISIYNNPSNAFNYKGVLYSEDANISLNNVKLDINDEFTTLVYGISFSNSNLLAKNLEILVSGGSFISFGMKLVDESSAFVASSQIFVRGDNPRFPIGISAAGGSKLNILDSDIEINPLAASETQVISSSSSNVHISRSSLISSVASPSIGTMLTLDSSVTIENSTIGLVQGSAVKLIETASLNCYKCDIGGDKSVEMQGEASYFVNSILDGTVVGVPKCLDSVNHLGEPLGPNCILMD